MVSPANEPSSSELRLVEVARELLHELKDLTPGKALEAKLNREYGPGTKYWDELARLSKVGLDEGWLANKQVDGERYRRSRLRPPSEDLHWFSITGVYMESSEVMDGEYHAHPYGEINMVIPVKGDSAQLAGLDDYWAHAGWTSPGPGSHHYPTVRGGAVIALFFLPSGRISYRAKPGDPQPVDPFAGIA